MSTGEAQPMAIRGQTQDESSFSNVMNELKRTVTPICESPLLMDIDQDLFPFSAHVDSMVLNISEPEDVVMSPATGKRKRSDSEFIEEISAKLCSKFQEEFNHLAKRPCLSGGNQFAQGLLVAMLTCVVFI